MWVRCKFPAKLRLRTSTAGTEPASTSGLGKLTCCCMPEAAVTSSWLDAVVGCLAVSESNTWWVFVDWARGGAASNRACGWTRSEGGDTRLTLLQGQEIRRDDEVPDGLPVLHAPSPVCLAEGCAVSSRKRGGSGVSNVMTMPPSPWLGLVSSASP